jgi:hypothetical protein
MQRGTIHIGVNDDGGNSHFVACAQYAHRNLAAIGYKNFFEHLLENRRPVGEPKILQETWP